MGAIFYQYSDTGILKHSVGSTAVPGSIDIFENINANAKTKGGPLVSKDNLCIITQIGVAMSEIVQFFPTFDDFIHHYWFGKGVGSIVCQGVLFLDCHGVFPGLSSLMTAIGEHRGEKIVCSFGDFLFTGILTNCDLQMVAEPETVLSFTINLGMTEHNLPTPKPKDPSC